MKSLGRVQLCNPMDSRLPGSSVHGIFQGKILDWVAVSFSRGSSWPRDQTQVSCIAGGRFTVWATTEGHVYLSIYTHTHTLFFRFPSHLDYQRILTRVPCALHYILISYLFYVVVCEVIAAVYSLSRIWLCDPMVCSPPGPYVPGISHQEY